jgi:subtilisin-like proprotein convertase family protein
VRQEGVCVPDSEAICGDGALSFDPESNTCTVTDQNCESGTELSANGTCVVAEGACGEGLALSDDGTCQPTESVCGDAAVFVESSGLCLPEATCDAEDVILDPDDDPSTPGTCVSPAEEIAANPDVQESETGQDGHNDPTLGGKADSITLPDPGTSASFAGSIAAPTDRDGDGEVDQDRDAFQFSGGQGQWVKVSVQSAGLPSPWFRVEGPGGYERQARVGGAGAAVRYLRLPAQGNYRVFVMPESARPGADGGPFGDAEWTYAGELERLGSQQATVPMWPSTPTASGDAVDLRDNYFGLSSFNSDQLVRVTVESVGADVEARVQLWSGSGELTVDKAVQEGDEFWAVVPDPTSDAPRLLVDWVRADGPDTGFEIKAEVAPDAFVLGSVGSGQSVTSQTRMLTFMNPTTYAVTVPSDHVIEITHENADDEEITTRAFDPSGRKVFEREDLEESENLNSAGEDDEGYFYAERAGTYLIELDPGQGISDHELTVTAHKPTFLGEFGPGDSLQQMVTTSTPEYRSDYYAFSAITEVSATFTFQATAPSPASEIDHDLKLHDLSQIADNLTVPRGRIRFNRGTGTVEIGPVPLKPGRYLIGHGLEDPLTDVTIDGSFSTTGIVENEPNDTLETARPWPSGSELVGDVLPGDRDVFTFTNSNANSEVFEVTLAADEAFDPSLFEDAWNCQLIAPDGTTVDSVSQRDQGCVLRAAADQTGDYAIIADYEGPELRRYTLNRTRSPATLEAEPNNRSDLAQTVAFNSSGDRAVGLGRWTPLDVTDYYELTVPSSVGTQDGAKLFVSLASTAPDAPSGELELFDNSGASVGTVDLADTESVITAVEGGQTYTVAVRGDASSIGETDGAYNVEATTYIPDVVSAASPGAEFSQSGSDATSTVSVSNCSSVTRVTVELDVSYTFRKGLAVWLTNPAGTQVQLWDETGGFNANLVGNIPLTFDSANSLQPFVGASGNGDWTLKVAAEAFPFKGTLNSWAVQLNCN